MTPILLHPAARAEFREAVHYYAAIDPALALGFESLVSEFEDSISRTPLLYHARRFNVRRANLTPRFQEWYIAYILWHEQVVILAFAHGKRRPFYFRKRIGESRRMF